MTTLALEGVGALIGRPPKCPKCGLPTHIDRTLVADHCPDCGTPLWNKCTACEKGVGAADAACPWCGAPTLYASLGFIQPK